ncbi:MAG: hypothetical protein IPI81_15215 [Flavobacteriales bacterium]|nr:hypothetical protein [Flavobacteriales bacterium]
MKDSYPHISLVRLCRSFGVTRQAFYQHFWTTQAYCMEHELVLVRVQEIRQDHRRLGTRKLMDKLQPFLLEHHIKMGRDALLRSARRSRSAGTTAPQVHPHHTLIALVTQVAQPDQGQEAHRTWAALGKRYHLLQDREGRLHLHQLDHRRLVAPHHGPPLGHGP